MEASRFYLFIYASFQLFSCFEGEKKATRLHLLREKLPVPILF